MSLPTEILTDMFPALALVILLAHARVGLPYSRTNRMFVIAIGLAVAALCFDMAYELLKGSASRMAWWAQWAVNLGYYAAVGPMAFCWFLFVCGSVSSDGAPLFRGWKRIVAIVPFLAYCALVATTPWTHAVFSIGPDAQYVRGSLFLSNFVFSFGYMVAASILALLRRRTAVDVDARQRCNALAFVPVPIVCAILIGCLFDDYALMLQGIAVSIVFVYFNLQREHGERDGLTGLSNRRRFDRYLAEKWSSGNGGRPWTLIIIDVNGFKAINDTYGHVGGDQVLKRVAESLKDVFGKKGSFIARYGGDEFVVVFDGESRSEVEACIKAVGDLLASDDDQADRMPVTFSAGYAHSDDGAGSPDELVANADRKMYSAKQAQRRA